MVAYTFRLNRPYSIDWNGIQSVAYKGYKWVMVRIWTNMAGQRDWK